MIGKNNMQHIYCTSLVKKRNCMNEAHESIEILLKSNMVYIECTFLIHVTYRHEKEIGHLRY